MKYVQPYGVTDPNAGYVNGNPAAGVAGSIPPALAFEQPLRELDNIIEQAGLTQSTSDMTQVFQALQIFDVENKLKMCANSGTQNAWVAVIPTLPGNSVPVGTAFWIKPALSNTGAVTCSLNGAAAAGVIKGDGTALAAGDVTGSVWCLLFWDGTNWELLAGLKPGAGGGTVNITNNTTSIPYVNDTSVTANTITANFSPAIVSLSKGSIISVGLANTNTAATTINVNALGPYNVVTQAGLALKYSQIISGELLLLEFDGAGNFQVLNQLQKPVASLNYYVSTTGNDNNTGTTAGSPFLTIQKAINTVAALDLNGQTATIQVADGAYAAGGYLNTVLNGKLIIRGNPGTPANCSINTGSSGAACFSANFAAQYYITGFRVSAPAVGGYGLVSQNAAYIYFSNISFAYCYNAHMLADFGYISTWIFGADGTGNYFIDGSATYHISINKGWVILNVSGYNSIYVNVACSFTAFAIVQMNGLIRANPSSCSIGGAGFGGTTGYKYSVAHNSVIVGGANPNYFPGNLAGVAATGGQYV